MAYKERDVISEFLIWTTLNMRYPSAITFIYNAWSNGIHCTQHGLYHGASYSAIFMETSGLYKLCKAWVKNTYSWILHELKDHITLPWGQKEWITTWLADTGHNTVCPAHTVSHIKLKVRKINYHIWRKSNNQALCALTHNKSPRSSSTTHNEQAPNSLLIGNTKQHYHSNKE